MKKTLVVDYLEDFVRRGKAVAFAYRRGLRSHRWTYQEVAATAFEFAARIEAHGISKGDRVLLWAENSAEWVVAFLGCMVRGAIVVPLDVQSTPDFVYRVQRQVEAKLAVLDASTRKQFELDLECLLLDEIARASSPESRGSPQAADLSSLLSEDDTVEIVFTSGTTAEPKGVCITHRNLMSNLKPLEDEIGRYLKWERYVHPIRFLNLLPLSHVFGQFMGIFVPQLLGGEVFFPESSAPSQIIETVKRERISVIICVPRILETLRERVQRGEELRLDPKRFSDAFRRAGEWGALKRWWFFRRIHWLFGLKFWAFISGGATLGKDTEEFWRRLGFVVIQGYGMTETASLISVNHPFKRGRGSIGKVMPGHEVKLGTNGEILVRGGNVSPGYWKQDGLSGGKENGWFHTGDVGEFDEAGNLYFKGRKKDVIVTAAGMKVYPDDIQGVLDRQSEVKASVVIPFGGPRGPEPLGVFILRGARQDPREVIDRANESLAEHQRLRRWYVWPEEDFPRTAMGKIKKQVVADKVGEALAGRVAGPRIPGGLDELIARVSGEAPVNLEASATLATDLKLDSLGRVELLNEIEDRYRIEVDEAAFSASTTVGDLHQIIREAKAEQTDDYPYPHWPHRSPFNWLRIILLYLVVFPLTRIMGRATIEGLEHLRAASEPLLFVANHLTMVDHALILSALPGRFGRRMSIAMDGELLKGWLRPPKGTPWLRRVRYRVQYLLVALFFNVFSMPQHSGFRRSFTFAGELMDRGFSVLVFPEGRRSPDGKLQPFKGGIGLLARGLGVPVVPVRLDGLYEVAKLGKQFARRGAIKVTIHRPVSYSFVDEPETIAKDLEQKVAC